MILIVLIEESPARVRGDEAVLGLRAIAVLPVVGPRVWVGDTWKSKACLPACR